MQGGVLAAILTGSLVPVSLDDGTAGGSSRMNSEVTIVSAQIQPNTAKL